MASLSESPLDTHMSIPYSFFFQSASIASIASMNVSGDRDMSELEVQRCSMGEKVSACIYSHKYFL